MPTFTPKKPNFYSKNIVGTTTNGAQSVQNSGVSSSGSVYSARSNASRPVAGFTRNGSRNSGTISTPNIVLQGLAVGALAAATANFIDSALPAVTYGSGLLGAGVGGLLGSAAGASLSHNAYEGAGSSDIKNLILQSVISENAAKPGFYTVKPNDTLIRIGLDQGQNWRDIVRWNNIDNPNNLEVGQVLRVVPPGTTVNPEGVVVRPVTSPTTTTSNQPLAATEPQKPANAVAPQPPTEPTEDAITFVWPAQGGVLTGFDEA
jgi:LysM repeat protein